MQGKSKSYALLIVMFCAFGLLIYGAYSPARKAQKQQIVCVKFKDGVQNQAIEKHMHEFAGLKHEIKQIVGYTAGKTILTSANGTDYDVMHYLTFQSADDIKAFEQSAAYRQFVSSNENSWAKTLIVNANIQPQVIELVMPDIKTSVKLSISPGAGFADTRKSRTFAHSFSEPKAFRIYINGKS